MNAKARLVVFEIATREDVTRVAEIEIHARLVVRADGLIAMVDEAQIKSVIETVVDESVTMAPRGKAKDVAV